MTNLVLLDTQTNLVSAQEKVRTLTNIIGQIPREDFDDAIKGVHVRRLLEMRQESERDMFALHLLFLEARGRQEFLQNTGLSMATYYYMLSKFPLTGYPEMIALILTLDPFLGGDP